MEAAEPQGQEADVPLSLRLFGHLAVQRGSKAFDLPPSRKVRALLGYLAVAPRPVSRSRLSDLLGDLPNDPRGELRWCLSKLRGIVDEPGRRRVLSREDLVWLDLSDCTVDALRIEAAMGPASHDLALEQLREVCDLFSGDFLEGLDLGRSPQLDHWLGMQRRRYRNCQESLLKRLIERLPEDPAALRPYAERWAQLSPLEEEAQFLLLKTLLASGQRREAEEHFAAVVRLFQAQDLESESLTQRWRDLRRGQRQTKAAPVQFELDHPGRSDRLQLAIPPPEAIPDPTRRASLAVMPFAHSALGEATRRLAQGLIHDIIVRLAKLRSMFVIARGSVFGLAEQGLSPAEAAERLGVDYFTSGLLTQSGDRLEVTVELVETRSGHILWSEEFDLKQEQTFLLLEEIGERIVAALANQVEAAERNRAILKAPSSLNAWEAYHCGLWHMYRFTQKDNQKAQDYFRQAVETDPTFARAYAGLSFTHWQNAFQRWADPKRESNLAYKMAGHSVMVDEHDPAAHLAMGRALWLLSRPEDAVIELERSVALSPNLALGHYALSFVQSQAGDPLAAIASSDHSRSLSPFDPLLFGMLGTRAIAHMRLGQFEEAAQWSLRAAARPNAHILILAIAAYCLALTGREEEGRAFTAVVRQTLPNFRVEDFLSRFRFAPDAEALFREGAKRLDFER